MKLKIIITVSIVLIVALVLFFAEQYARKNAPEPVGVASPHPLLLWVMNPGNRFDSLLNEQIYINTLGMRSKEPDDVHPSILIMGDSPIYGSTVNTGNTLDACLERSLVKRLKRPVRVYNGGVPGYTSYQADLFLKRIAPVIKPDVVIISCIASDINCNMPEFYRRIPTPPFSYMYAFLWKSELFKSLFLKSSRQTAAVELNHEELKNSPYLVDYAKASLPYYRKNIQSMYNTAHKNGAKLVCELFMPNYKMFTRDLHGINYFTLDHKDSKQIDMVASWKEKGLTGSEHFSDGIHPTVEGYNLIGEDLADILIQDKRFEAIVNGSQP